MGILYQSTELKSTYALEEWTVPGTSGPPLRCAIVLLLPSQGIIASGGGAAVSGVNPRERASF
jgi:hypothetical protein